MFIESYTPAILLMTATVGAGHVDNDRRRDPSTVGQGHAAHATVGPVDGDDLGVEPELGTAGLSGPLQVVARQLRIADIARVRGEYCPGDGAGGVVPEVGIVGSLGWPVPAVVEKRQAFCQVVEGPVLERNVQLLPERSDL
jgi:hypothetical protein